MTDQEINERCLDWAHWCRTRKYFAPPVPANILAQLQPRRRVSQEPDGPMDPDTAFFNMAISCLSDQRPEEAICFSLYYYHGFRPVKAIAAAMGISRRTFYYRLHGFSLRALKLSGTIKRMHLEQSGILAEAV